jgi:hypothetical protein
MGPGYIDVDLFLKCICSDLLTSYTVLYAQVVVSQLKEALDVAVSPSPPT